MPSPSSPFSDLKDLSHISSQQFCLSDQKNPYLVFTMATHASTREPPLAPALTVPGQGL